MHLSHRHSVPVPSPTKRGDKRGEERIHTAKVVPPQRTNLVLATHIPNIELDILVGNRLDVEADSRDRGDVLAEFELVKDSGLAGGVEPEHEQAHFLRSEDLAHHF